MGHAVGRRVLLVEDDACLALVLKDTLSDFGFVVVQVAATAEEAIRAADSEALDLAIVDIWLKGGSNGLEAVAHLAGVHGIPCIASSAHALEDEARAAGATVFLAKPYLSHELEAALGAALRAGSAAAPEAGRRGL